MSETEKEVISLIRNSNDPAVALDVALKLILEFVAPLEAAPCKTPELPSVAS
jgi:hypothetical protein